MFTNMHTDSGITRKQILSNLLWKYFQQSAGQMVSLIVSIVLARLLSPEDFGLIAMVIVFITIAEVFANSGFGKALVQKQNVDDLDFSSVFYFSILFSIALYTVIYLTAPTIAEFFDQELITPILRVLGIRIIFAGVNTVQFAFVARNMIFKKLFVSTIWGIGISGIAGIAMAYQGFGVWAIVIQYMVRSALATIVLFTIISWRPRLNFSLTRLKELFSFGWKLLAAGMLDTLTTQLRQLVIGKLYMPSDLAYYNRGIQLPQFIMGNINSTISAVMFPTVSRQQNNMFRLKQLTRRSISVTSYIVFPLLMGLACVAEPLVRVLLTDKWIMTVPFLRIFCFTHAIVIMQIAMQNAITALGRSDIFLKMDAASKVVGITLLIIVVNK